MWLYVVLVFVIVLLVIGFLIYNNLVKWNNKVKEAFSVMDIYLKKRWDLIPSIVQTVKGYAIHEKSTLEKITALRNEAYNNMNIESKLKTNERLKEDIHGIMILGENYPELKADENFKELNEQLIKIEEDIANTRKYYNAVVRIFNNKVEMFPSNLIAKIFRFKVKPMFEINASDRENVVVKF